MAAQTDPLFGQLLKIQNGVDRNFKPLSQTINELESGVAPVNALEQQWDATKPIIELYFTSRDAVREEHKRSDCQWLCDGNPHYYASICRVCKGNSGPQTAGRPFSVQLARKHFFRFCTSLSDQQRAGLYRAFLSVDVAFVFQEQKEYQERKRLSQSDSNLTIPVVASSTSKGKKRPVRSETELDMEQDEILERQLAEEDRREYRPSPVSSVDEDELRSRCLPAQSVLATPPAKKARTTINGREERLSQRSSRKEQVTNADETPRASTHDSSLEAAAPSEAQAGPSQPALKKRKLKNTSVQEAVNDKVEAPIDTHPIEATEKPKKGSKSKDYVSDGTRKPHAQSAPAAPLPQTPASDPPKAKIGRPTETATLADFGQLLKAANLTDLDELKAGLDRKRVPRFVGYLAEAFPEHIGSHLTRFNLIEAFESFLENL